jgi:multisubunit Na+/H+ antiporter MnhB subunit
MTAGLSAGIAVDIGLAALVAAMALWTITVRDAYAAVIGFIGYGLLLALVWVRLDAVDVALTEAAIGGGVTGVLLLRAVGALHRGAAPLEDGPPPGPATRRIAALACAAVAAGLAFVVLGVSGPAPTLAPLAAEHLPATGLENPVTGVLLAYRALDTLLEKVVLLLALIGIWSLAPDGVWGGRPTLGRPGQASDTLRFLAQLLPPVGIVVGIHVLWVGANAPGGAFQGGAVLAAMWILAMMAGLAPVPAIGRPWLRAALVVGPLAFLAVGVAGIFVADGFLAYPPAFAKPLILAIEAAITLSIAVTLAMMVAGPPQRPDAP